MSTGEMGWLLEDYSGAAARRFMSKVDWSGDCWLWTGCISTEGYGRFNVGAKRGGEIVYAHRWMYEARHGALDPSLFVCHHCDTRLCVNPDHLFAGTASDNMRDMWAKGRGINPLTDANARKTHCKRGHPFEGDNLYRRNDGGRMCRACNKLHGETSKRRRQERAA